MKKIYHKNQRKAFSLIELSIVIVISSILLTGGLVISVNALNSAKIKLTKDRMAEVYKALGNFVIVNKRLPCPAPITDTKSGTSTYGVAVAGTLCATTGVATSTVSGSTNLVRGMLPVKTLGLPFEMAEDGFGDKFEYMVDAYHTVISDGVNASTDFGAAVSNITIIELPGATSQTIETAAAFAIISLGANKFGAYGADSVTRNAIPTDTQEATNVTTYVSSNDALFTKTLYISSGNSDAFDDIILFKTRNALVLDFNALSLIPCAAATISETYGNMDWPTGWYGRLQIATASCSTSYDGGGGVTKPTKRCNAFGTWETLTTNPCLQDTSS